MKISFVRVTFEPHLQLTKDIDGASSDMDTITNTSLDNHQLTS